MTEEISSDDMSDDEPNKLALEGVQATMDFFGDSNKDDPYLRDDLRIEGGERLVRLSKQLLGRSALVDSQVCVPVCVATAMGFRPGSRELVCSAIEVIINLFEHIDNSKEVMDIALKYLDPSYWEDVRLLVLIVQLMKTALDRCDTDVLNGKIPSLDIVALVIPLCKALELIILSSIDADLLVVTWSCVNTLICCEDHNIKSIFFNEFQLVKCILESLSSKDYVYLIQNNSICPGTGFFFVLAVIEELDRMDGMTAEFPQAVSLWRTGRFIILQRLLDLTLDKNWGMSISIRFNNAVVSLLEWQDMSRLSRTIEGILHSISRLHRADGSVNDSQDAVVAFKNLLLHIAQNVGGLLQFQLFVLEEALVRLETVSATAAANAVLAIVRLCKAGSENKSNVSQTIRGTLVGRSALIRSIRFLYFETNLIVQMKDSLEENAVDDHELSLVQSNYEYLLKTLSEFFAEVSNYI